MAPDTITTGGVIAVCLAVVELCKFALGKLSNAYLPKPTEHNQGSLDVSEVLSLLDGQNERVVGMLASISQNMSRTADTLERLERRMEKLEDEMADVRLDAARSGRLKS